MDKRTEHETPYSTQDKINKRLAAYADISSENTCPVNIDWKGLRVVNKDAVGWIYISDTPVNYPVYQARDNEKYLHTTAEGTYSIGGQIFMDFENTGSGLVDYQTILYGHHLKNGSMFKAIADTAKRQVFDGIKTIWYATPYASYKLKPLMTYLADETDESVRMFRFASDEDFKNYLHDKLAHAKVACAEASNVISKTTRVLSLVTCNYTRASTRGRTVMICALESQTPT